MPNNNPSPENRFKPGQSGNPGGRPKGGMKDYLKRKFSGMTDEELEAFAKKIPYDMQVKLAEGNPSNDVKLTGNINISNVLDEIENGYTPNDEKMED